jgi:hypothetical protein
VSRDLRLLAGAVFLSAAGDLLALIVLALHVDKLTGSRLAVSALFATTLVLVVALAPLAGFVADRFESVLLIAASLAQALRRRRVGVQQRPGSDPRALVAADGRQRVRPAGRVRPDPGRRRLAAGDRGHRHRRSGTLRRLGGRAGVGRGVCGAGGALLVNAASFVAIADAVSGHLLARRDCRAPVATGIP